MADILVMGAGGFGVALAVMARAQGHRVTVWSPFAEEAEQLSVYREHRKLLKGVRIPEDVSITASAKAALEGQDLIILATPSFAARGTARLLKDIPADMAVACVSKGLEADTCKTLSEVLREELPRNAHVMLSGPSHAEEVAAGEPTAVVAASQSREAAEMVQDTLSSESFRIYVSDDVTGVELGGALKNVIALAAGILDGLGAGDNAKAALMTRGVAEIARLGVAMGAKSETFAGLSGIGDLIVTCSSMHSRNRRCGILIGQGTAADKAVGQIGMTVEGYACAKTARELAAGYDVTMPITQEVCAVLYHGKPPKQALKELMGRPKRHESESAWLLSR